MREVDSEWGSLTGCFNEHDNKLSRCIKCGECFLYASLMGVLWYITNICYEKVC